MLRLADPALRATLPRVGVEGTVRRLLPAARAGGRIRAKSGTLATARAYAGYAEGPEGRRYVFAVVANNFTAPAPEVRAELARWIAALLE